MAEVKTQNENNEKKEKKPTNLVRVNDSMIYDTKQAGLKAVTLGLRDNEGNEKIGKIFVSEKQVNADKNTMNLSKGQQKSYVALDRNKDYTFSVKGPKDAEGKTTYENMKISGADIIEQNKAYMKEKSAQRANNLAGVGKEQEVEQEVEAGK